jgi:copper oxidase (laccase) domain-containing protein
VLLFGDTVVGVAHCGWRGLKLRIIQKTLDAMVALGGRNIVAAVGPSIGKKNYTVEDDFLQEFPGDLDCMENQAGVWHADLRKIAHKQLAGSQDGQGQGGGGVKEWSHVKDIEDVCFDTYDSPNVFFSCRRFLSANEPVRTQASVIML